MIPFFIILIIFLLPATSIFAQEINNSTDRITTKYFSVLKQPGYDWNIDKDNNVVVFFKNNKKTFETHVLGIGGPFGDKKFSSNEELLIETKKDIKEELGNRVEFIKFESEVYKIDNTKCSKHYFLGKDLKVPKKMKKFDFMYIEEITAYCIHPTKKDIIIKIGYSHRWRYTKEPIHEEYKKQANEFLEQIQFVE